MIEYSIRKPITMLMILLVMAVFGMYTYRMLAVDMFPDVSIPIVTTTVIYPGAGPEEIEQSIVEKIEDEVSLLDGLDKLQVIIKEGVAVFVLNFTTGIDVDIAAMDVKDKLDAIRASLPDDIQDPVVSKVDLGAMPVITLSLNGPGTPQQVREYSEDLVQPALSRISGVAQVDIVGGLEREIHVNLNNAELEARGIAFTDVYGVIQANNLNYPLGDIEGTFKNTSIRLDGQLPSIDALRLMEIPGQFGSARLGDLGTIVDSYKEVEQVSYYSQNPTVTLSILKRSDANVVQMAQNVLAQIPQINATLPNGYAIELINNEAEFTENTVNDTFNNIYIGVGLTALILLLFLRNFGTTIIAAVTMPATLIMTFTIIWMSGFTLNMLTLMALGLSVGLLVTNTIVVLENIIRHLSRKHDDPRTAALKGTSEVAVSVIASALTNMAVFIPIAFMQSIVGQMFKEFGLTMVYATLFSLFISFTLAPLMASRILKVRPESMQKTPRKNWLHTLENGYTFLLDKALSKLGILVVIALIVVSAMGAMWAAKQLGNEFIPRTDKGLFSVDVDMPSGTNISTTEQTALEIEKRIRSLPGIKNVSITIGSANPMQGGKNTASLMVQLVPAAQRPVSTDELVNRTRALLANIPAAIISVRSASGMGPNQSKYDLEVQVDGPNMDIILQSTEQVISILDTMQGVASAINGYKSGAPELVLRPKGNVLADYGLTSGQVAQLVRLYVVGDAASVLRLNNEEYDILVQIDPELRKSKQDLLSLTVPTPRGFVPLSSLVQESNESGPAGLERLNKKSMVKVNSNLFPSLTTGEAQKKLQTALQENPLPKGASISFGGDADMQADMMEEMLVAMIMAVLLTYILLTGLLESFLQPVIIMFTIPLGAIGVFWALFLTGANISMVSLMAMVMLIGIVVNNAILILDYCNILNRKKGLEPRESALKGAGSKFRAILMTNIATIISMLPLALGLGEGAELRQPMAVASIGGLIVSTLMTIFLVPQLYWITTRKKS